RGLFRWALEAGMVKVDLTAGVKNPQRPKGDGFRPWTEDDVAAYEKCWPIGTRQRVWLDVMLYTGLRRGDAMRCGAARSPAYSRRGSLRRSKATGSGGPR